MTEQSTSPSVKGKKPPPVKSPHVKKRHCLRCDALFISNGAGNRLCPSCVHNAIERDGPNFERLLD